jgi:hypothetical protein
MVGLKTPHDFDCKPTVFQKVVDIQCGNGAPININLDGYNDSKIQQKIISVTMIDTDQHKEWFSLVSIYAVGQRESLVDSVTTHIPKTNNSNKKIISNPTPTKNIDGRQ